MTTWQEILADIVDKCPPPEDPRCFSFFLAHLIHVYEPFLRALPLKTVGTFPLSSWTLDKILKDYLRIRFPGGQALLSRGLRHVALSTDILHNVEMQDMLRCYEAQPWQGLGTATWNNQCWTFWSENTALALAGFTVLPQWASHRKRTHWIRQLRGWRPIPLGAACLIVTVPVDRIVAFGTTACEPGETGWFGEAELYVEIPTTTYTQAVFGVTDRKSARVGRSVSRAEQQYYGLSGQILARVNIPGELLGVDDEMLKDDEIEWDEQVVYLHPDTDLTLFGDKLIDAVRLEPRTDWRRLA